MNKEEVMCFAQAYLYESAIEYEKINDSSEYKYILDKPTSLPKYLQSSVDPSLQRLSHPHIRLHIHRRYHSGVAINQVQQDKV